MTAQPSTPFSISSEVWPGTSKLIEEIGELGQVLGKLIGTGGAVDHWDGSNLNVRLVEEIADVLAAAEFFVDANGLDSAAISERRQAKLALFEQWHADGTGGAFDGADAVLSIPSVSAALIARQLRLGGTR